MTVLILWRRFLADYVRNPVNLLLLAVVPAVFVVVVAGSMASAAKLLGGAGGPAVETATAGWAAAFVAGIAMYFQTAATATPIGASSSPDCRPLASCSPVC